jgi:hypothetical protein
MKSILIVSFAIVASSSFAKADASNSHCSASAAAASLQTLASSANANMLTDGTLQISFSKSADGSLLVEIVSKTGENAQFKTTSQDCKTVNYEDHDN